MAKCFIHGMSQKAWSSVDLYDKGVGRFSDSRPESSIDWFQIKVLGKNHHGFPGLRELIS